MFSIIVAIGKNREIGKENKLLWHIPEDLKNFRRITNGKTVVMGRKTFESIGRLLPNRKNIILSREVLEADLKKLENETTKVEVFDDFQKMIDSFKNSKEEIFIIGGEQIYKMALKEEIIDKLYISYVDFSDDEADAYFPVIENCDWKVIEEEKEQCKFMPKVKFTKEIIVEAAYELMKIEGFNNLSVRKIAKYLKSSTAPIYFNFNTVDDLKEEIIILSKEKLKKYLYGNYSERKLLNSAVGFVAFAREERELFRAIFLDGAERFKELYDETLNTLLTEEILMVSFPKLTFQEAKLSVRRLWYFLFGYATLICTSRDDDYRNDQTNEKIEEKILEITSYFRKMYA